MNIQQLLYREDEVVGDSSDDIAEQIAQQYEPVPQKESDQEGVEVLPRIVALQALQLLRQLRLHEEQSEDCNSAWLKSLDRYENIVQKRMIDSRQQRPISDYFTTNAACQDWTCNDTSLQRYSSTNTTLLL